MDNLHGKKFKPGRPIASVPDSPTVKISLVEGGTLPQKAHPGDACYDCYVRELPKEKDYEVGAGMFKIPLGFKLDIPPGWKAMLWGRSGLACQGAYTHIGTIDHGYKQEVCCITNKLGWSMGGAGPSYRVCQMSFEKVHEVNLLEVDDIDSSGSRGGFGSTGMDKLQILIAQAEKLADKEKKEKLIKAMEKVNEEFKEALKKLED